VLCGLGVLGYDHFVWVTSLTNELPVVLVFGGLTHHGLGGELHVVSELRRLIPLLFISMGCFFQVLNV
jgi:hypothetical protein